MQKILMPLMSYDGHPDLCSPNTVALALFSQYPSLSGCFSSKKVPYQPFIQSLTCFFSQVSSKIIMSVSNLFNIRTLKCDKKVSTASVSRPDPHTFVFRQKLKSCLFVRKLPLRERKGGNGKICPLPFPLLQGLPISPGIPISMSVYSIVQVESFI